MKRGVTLNSTPGGSPYGHDSDHVGDVETCIPGVRTQLWPFSTCDSCGCAGGSGSGGGTPRSAHPSSYHVNHKWYSIERSSCSLNCLHRIVSEALLRLPPAKRKAPKATEGSCVMTAESCKHVLECGCLRPG